MADWIGSFISVCFLTAVTAVIAWFRARRLPVSDRAGRLDTWLRWWYGLAIGVGAAWIGIAFLLVPQVFADQIGYAQTPFQTEVACANLAFATIGFCCIRITDRAREVGALGYLVFLWGALIEHVHTAIAYDNIRPGNVGGILIVDFVVPLVALLLCRARRRVEPAPQATVSADR